MDGHVWQHPFQSIKRAHMVGMRVRQDNPLDRHADFFGRPQNSLHAVRKRGIDKRQTVAFLYQITIDGKSIRQNVS